VRGGSPDDGDGALGIDAREWEEEQVKLDRDWYTGAEEGGVTGDDEHNPLAQYEDLSALKQAEIATKQVVSLTPFSGTVWILITFCRERFRQSKLNTFVGIGIFCNLIILMVDL
jgi:hypothetical protein